MCWAGSSEDQEEKHICPEAPLVGELWHGDGYVFCNAMGEHLSPSTVYHTFKRIAAAIDIPDARLHDLRHSYAVASLQAGDDIKTVQSNLGHHTASFTLDVYGYVTAQMQQTRWMPISARSLRRKGKQKGKIKAENKGPLKPNRFKDPKIV